MIPRPPHPTGKRRSGTVASNSWSKRQTFFPLKTYVLYNERPGKDVLCLEQEFEATVPDHLRA